MANTKKRWTTEEIEILKKHYPTEGDAVFKRLPGRTAKSCRIQASKLKISKNISSAIIQDDRKYIRLWTKAEDEILREYYAEEGSNVYKRFNGRTRNACISKSAQLHLQYGPTMYKGPALDEWIISAVKQGITKINQSMTYSEIILKSGELPELHLKMEYDKTGELKIYEDSILSNEKKYHIQQVEKLADTMKLQIKENKMIVNSSEKRAADDAIRLIVGCYLVYFSYDS